MQNYEEMSTLTINSHYSMSVKNCSYKNISTISMLIDFLVVNLVEAAST
jgi:hypothetical protein